MMTTFRIWVVYSSLSGGRLGDLWRRTHSIVTSGHNVPCRILYEPCGAKIGDRDLQLPEGKLPYRAETAKLSAWLALQWFERYSTFAGAGSCVLRPPLRSSPYKLPKIPVPVKDGWGKEENNLRHP